MGSGGGNDGTPVAEKRVGVNGGDARAHVHGASCGHIAVLHDEHVDFLVEGGQLECFDGKEVGSVVLFACDAVGCSGDVVRFVDRSLHFSLFSLVVNRSFKADC